jgi:hypothetical protein
MRIKVLMTERAFLESILPHARAEDPRLARATAETLARFSAPRARIGLLHLLHHADRAVVLAAIRGLASTGTAAEIEHLLPFAAGWLTDRTLKRAAREAIDAIRGRTNGSAGSLSLAPNDARGALSL